MRCIRLLLYSVLDVVSASFADHLPCCLGLCTGKPRLMNLIGSRKCRRSEMPWRLSRNCTKLVTLDSPDQKHCANNHQQQQALATLDGCGTQPSSTPNHRPLKAKRINSLAVGTRLGATSHRFLRSSSAEIVVDVAAKMSSTSTPTTGENASTNPSSSPATVEISVARA